jgi:hypothetical protein
MGDAMKKRTKKLLPPALFKVNNSISMSANNNIRALSTSTKKKV